MDASLFAGDLVQSSRLLYTPSAFARASLVHLQEIGELQARRPHTSQREDLESYLFFIVCAGAGELEYGGQTWALKAGDCVFLDCRRPYAHRTGPQLWQLRWVHFTGPNLHAVYQKYAERGGRPVLHPADPEPWQAVWQRLYELAGSEDHIRDMRLCESLTALLTLLMAESWNPGAGRATPGKQSVQHIKDYLDRNFTAGIRLDDLAAKFYINKFYLTRVFKEQFGLSVQQYLQQVRVTHAKELLRFSDQTVEQIAAACGMPDPNYFARVFRRVEGVSPSVYRKSW